MVSQEQFIILFKESLNRLSNNSLKVLQKYQLTIYVNDIQTQDLLTAYSKYDLLLQVYEILLKVEIFDIESCLYERYEYMICCGRCVPKDDPESPHFINMYIDWIAIDDLFYKQPKNTEHKRSIFYEVDEI